MPSKEEEEKEHEHDEHHESSSHKSHKHKTGHNHSHIKCSSSFTSICLVSHHPFFSTFREAVETLRTLIRRASKRHSL